MYFGLKTNFLRKYNKNKKNIVLGNASCVEFGKELLRLPDAKHSNEGGALKLKKNLFHYYINRISIR